MATTVTEDITAITDDGFYVAATSFDNSAATVTLGDTSNKIGFVRFQTVAIPQYARITAATLRFTAASTDAGALTVTIKGEAADDPDAPTTFGDAAGRTRTTASTAWAFPSATSGQNYTSDSILDIVQEIVNRSGWATGQDMQFFLETSGGDTDKRVFHSRDAGSSNLARLSVTYDDPIEEDIEQKVVLSQTVETPINTLLSKQHYAL